MDESTPEAPRTTQPQLVLAALPRVGVLGAARIVPKALLAAAPGLIDVCAVAARDPVRARAFADAQGIVDSHGSYEELLARPDIDAVYVALPAALHAQWTLAALRAGKHVLCEKPFGLGEAEARAAVACASEHGLLLMEAHHWRYHPLAEGFRVAARDVGAVSQISAVFDAPIRAGNIRLDTSLGAGVLLDFGCYLVQWLALASGDDEPEVLEASAVEGDPGVDLAFRASLRAASGARMSLACDMRPDVTFLALVEVVGHGGKVRFENPLNGQDARLIVLRHSAPAVITEAAGPTTFRRQLEAFVAALRGGAPPPTSGAAIVRTQALLDRLYRAAGLPTRDALARPTSG
jgi:predicted dehydrogenase